MNNIESLFASVCFSFLYRNLPFMAAATFLNSINILTASSGLGGSGNSITLTDKTSPYFPLHSSLTSGSRSSSTSPGPTIFYQKF